MSRLAQLGAPVRSGHSVDLRSSIAGLLAIALTSAGVVLVGSGAPVAADVRSTSLSPTGAILTEGEPTEDGAPSEEALALAQADETEHRVEVQSAATETQTVWANPNGTLTLAVTETPTRVERPNGSLVDINTTLHSTAEGLEPVASPVEVVLSGSGDGVLAQALVNDGQDSLGLGFDEQLSAPVVQGDAATYQLDAASDVRVAATESGFSAHVVLTEAPPAPPVYRFPLQLDGLTASLEGGSLSFTDATGDVVAESSLLRMWDSRADAFGDPANVVPIEAALIAESGQHILELRPSMDFLTDPGTVYPVTVDPDVILGTEETLAEGQVGTKETSDTYVTDAYPNSSFMGDWSLRVGSPNGADKYRSFVNFNVNPYAGNSVTNAELRLYQYGAGSCTSRRMDLLMATTGWDPAGSGPLRTWNRQPATASPDGRFAASKFFNHSLECGGRAWEALDVTSIVSTWTGLQRTRYGIMLKTPADRELMPEWEKRFCSADLNTTASGNCKEARKPELRITYTPQVGDQPGIPKPATH